MQHLSQYIGIDIGSTNLAAIESMHRDVDIKCSQGMHTVKKYKNRKNYKIMPF